jgi:hypothetical protein
MQTTQCCIVVDTYFVEVVIGADELLKLALDVEQLLFRKLELRQWDSSFAESTQEPNFVRLQEDETFTLGIGSSCGPAHPMNVVLWIICPIRQSLHPASAILSSLHVLPGGSNWMTQSTAGISRPRAATSVAKRVPESALQNSKNRAVRVFCFI